MFFIRSKIFVYTVLWAAALFPWECSEASPAEGTFPETVLMANSGSGQETPQTEVHKNCDLADGVRCGWQIELPSSWYSIPDVSPGWPYGAGWRTAAGDTGLIITFLKSVDENEYAVLRSRRYLESETKLNGCPARLFHKIEGPSFRQVYYINHSGGIYRITSFGITKDKAQLQKNIQSFAFISRADKTASSNSYSNSNLALSLTLPDHNPKYEIKETGKGLSVFLNDTKIAVITPRTAAAQPGQSFRGLARQIGRDYITDAQSLKRFEPYQIGGMTGYLAVWQTKDEKLVGPVIYLPYSRGSYNILEFDLTAPEYIDDFFKIVSSLKLKD
ncbi:hypothetical protein IJT93_13015 [bacterium]|nr:hypothetical protein [bacterium]